MSRGTPKRSVRVEDELWDAAKEAADKRGDNLSDILRDRLKSYLTEDQQEGRNP